MSSTTAEQLCRRFSLADIKLATGNFSDEHVIGGGGFGKVYKGLIDNGSVTVAIKRLVAKSNQGEAEFEAEMKTLTKFRHRNLVSLIGFCSEHEEMILVYDYMPNGTLSDHLYKDGSSSLSWNERLKICIGAGRGLDYLHSGCSIIHRDVKSTNILLDDNFTAKVSDFGLAKHLSTYMLESHVITNVKGSFGYFDPSYFTTGRLTKASDTYAFGVVLLEVLSGRPAVEARLAENELCMTMWAQERIRNGKAEQIVASNLKGEISEGCLKTFVGVVKRCLHHEPKKRLTMTRAVVQLELALEQQERKGMTTQKLQFWPFWNRDIPSGSTQKDENEVEVDKLGPAIQEEDAFETKHSVDMLPICVPAIPLAEIKDITDNFGSNCWIAYGIFHGVLKNGQDAAIKKLNETLPHQQFIEQVSTLSSLKHDNLVQLVGYCLDGDVQVLVSEFSPRGSLRDILHGRQVTKGTMLERGPALSWAQRIEIAVGAAKGLCYIHDKGLSHQNIKSSNVLLFDDETAKVTDIHLSTEHPCNCKSGIVVYYCLPHPSSLGYHPPECKWGFKTQKGDVYSFGMVLLELLTGSKLFGYTRRGGYPHLVPWAQIQLNTRNVHKIVDARLKGDYPPEAAVKMAEIAEFCLQYEDELRPGMRVVLQELQPMLQTPRVQEELCQNCKHHSSDFEYPPHYYQTLE